jgi:threonine dehydrogenase-like Zn-dependent dehydrogenase
MCAAADHAGAGRVIAIDRIDERLSMAREFGATDTVDVTGYDGDEELVSAIEERTDGNVGPDVVIEATGVPETVPQAIEIPHDGGTFVEAGHFAYTGDVEINPTRIVQKELQIIGARAAPASQFRAGLGVLHRHADEMPFLDLFNHRVEGLDAAAVAEAFEIQRGGGAYRATVHPDASRRRVAPFEPPRTSIRSLRLVDRTDLVFSPRAACAGHGETDGPPTAGHGSGRGRR